MKEIKNIVLVHLMLNLYLLAIFQPLYPILEYIIHYDYIVEELCENRDKPVLACNGKCYLGKQLTADEKDSGEDPKPLPPSVDFDKLLTVREGQMHFTLFEPETLLSQPLFNSGLTGTDHLSQVFRPAIF
jgi:hypothetical protein